MEIAESICKVCNKKNSSGEELVVCMGPCHKKIHSKCVGFTPATMKFYRQCQNLSFQCDECTDDPAKMMNETLNKILSFMCIFNERLNRQEINCDQIIKQCELLNENVLKSENELKGEISKVSFFKNQSAKATAETDTKDTIVPMVIVRPKIMQKCSLTRNDLTKKINSNDIAINSVNNIQNGGIEIKCKNEDDTIKLHEEAVKELGKDYTVIIPKLRKPKIRLTNMSDKLTDVDILLKLKQQNEFLKVAEMKVLHTYEIKNNETFGAIIEVDPKTFNVLITAGEVSIGMNTCKITECINVLRCYKCCGYNHKANLCKNKKACLRCGGEHELKECEAIHSECINCKTVAQRLKLNIDLNHPAWSRVCPVLQKKMDREKQRTQYAD